MIRKFRCFFPVFLSNLMFLRRVVPLFFQTAEQRPWSWVQDPWYESCEFSRELANVVCRSTCRVQRLLIGDFTRTSSNDERRGQERLNCKVSVRYKWFAKFRIRKFRWVFPVFSSNLMFLRRVVPLFFQMAEQRPWCWVQGPWHESCEFSYELASINVVFWSTCHV